MLGPTVDHAVRVVIGSEPGDASGMPADSAGHRDRLMAPLDVERAEADSQPLIRSPERKPWTRCNVGLMICMGGVLVFLIVMAAAFTGGAGGGGAAPGGAGFVMPPGGIKGCDDSEALCLIASPVPTPEHDYRAHPRKVSGSLGLVAADQSRCADIGAAVLEEGGHAVDAVVAAALCQGVVNPFASGVGGGHFATIRSANGSSEFINAREVAPGAATADMYSGKPALASIDGGLAIAVPLELKGLELAWRRHGRLPWARLVAPAAAIARHGFAAHPYYVYLASSNYTLNRLRSEPLMAEAFLVRDATGTFRAPRVGELCCRRPVLADTLDAVGRYGVSWLYEDARLEAMAAEVAAAGGIITAADFKAAHPEVVPLLRYRLPGPPAPAAAAAAAAPAANPPAYYELLVPPPPSSGAVLALALSIVLGYNTSTQQMGPALAAHRTVEAMKHVFAVRMALGDPGTPAAPFADVAPVLADIADAAFADSLRSLINDSGVLPLSQYGGRWNPQAGRATAAQPPRHPPAGPARPRAPYVAPPSSPPRPPPPPPAPPTPPRPPPLPATPAAPPPGQPPPPVGRPPPAPPPPAPQAVGVSPDDHGTSHLAVLDREGNAVSLTTTVNGVFGSNVMSRSTGILFNNEMDDFSRPGAANKYGLQPAAVNYPAPFKRPLSSMSPSLLLRPDGALALVVGASNGPRILTGILQTVLRLLYEGMDPLAAVSGARLHDQWLPDRCLFENYTLNGVAYTTDPAVLQGLEQRGTSMVPYTDQLGDVQAIVVGAANGAASTAVSDPRKDGAPAAARA